MIGALLAAIVNTLAGILRLVVPSRENPEPQEPGGEERLGMDFCHDESEQITPHFNASEFVCIDKSDPFKISRLLVERLEGLRERLGNRPLTINSGFRTIAHNKRIGGVPNSLHTKGMAADMSPPAGMSLSDFQKKARAYWYAGGLGGFGRYDWGIHVDVGRVKEWDERSAT